MKLSNSSTFLCLQTFFFILDNALYTQTRSSFNDYIADGSLLNNYAHIFDLLMRMRQSVDHPYLVVYSKKDAREQHGVTVANGTTDCDICHEPPTDRVTSTCCQAAFCRSCVLDYMTTLNGANTPCPSCRSPLSIDLNQNQNDVVDDNTLLLDIANEKEVSISREGMPTLKELRHVASGSILRRIDLAEFATSTKVKENVENILFGKMKLLLYASHMPVLPSSSMTTVRRLKH